MWLTNRKKGVKLFSLIGRGMPMLIGRACLSALIRTAVFFNGEISASGICMCTTGLLLS